MSNVFSSPNDELGNNNASVVMRKIEDIAVLDAPNLRYILKRNTGVINRLTLVGIGLPVLITAGDSMRIRNGVNTLAGFAYGGAADTPMFMSLPLKLGKVTNFSDNGVGKLRVNAPGSDIQVIDTVKITGSRNQTYNGNNIVTAIDPGVSFDLGAVDFVNADGQCEWFQVKVHISAVVEGDGTDVDLTVTDHPFALNDWINIYDATGNDDINNKTFQIIGVPDENTIIIDTGAAFAGNTTGNIDTGIGTFDVDHDLVANFPDGTRRNLFDLSGSFSPAVRSLIVFLRFGIFDFNIGRTRDFDVISISNSGLFSESNNWKSLDDRVIDYRNTVLEIKDTPLVTTDYASLFVIGGAGNMNAVTNNCTIDFPSLVTAFTIPDELGDDLLFNISNFRRLSDDTTYFSAGFIEQTAGTTIDGSPGIVIPTVGDTSPYRISDTIRVLKGDGGTYDGQAGSITSIVADISITVGITFTSEDDNLLIQNETTASITGDDPRLTTFANQDLKNSMSTAKLSLVPASAETIGSIVQNTWVPVTISTNWTILFAERFTSTTDGILTYTGIETADFSVPFSVTFEVGVGGGTRQAEVSVFKNGVEELTNAQKFDNNGVVQVGGIAIFELETNDTIQVFIRNTGDTNDLVITQASLTPTRSG